MEIAGYALIIFAVAAVVFSGFEPTRQTDRGRSNGSGVARGASPRLRAPQRGGIRLPSRPVSVEDRGGSDYHQAPSDGKLRTTGLIARRESGLDRYVPPFPKKPLPLGHGAVDTARVVYGNVQNCVKLWCMGWEELFSHVVRAIREQDHLESVKRLVETQEQLKKYLDITYEGAQTQEMLRHAGRIGRSRAATRLAQLKDERLLAETAHSMRERKMAVEEEMARLGRERWEAEKARREQERVDSAEKEEKGRAEQDYF